ncbi:formate-nitrite transporter family [Micromonas commoda]|uniref:Formate-nitrite transporter family n=1 Tax=Micromonas commoda (strain RCC299 / NOUM17 / CCMP2709) TaxID=296587 RepID=C1FDD6_MICCC|nr:formate-nitrite transporter family [Micromonas commoda]ACO68371.1 formate-nitrite transporter family [Micromonas commoda]|eukprot:XP_002507113.1 formate-nitrite transporter family [Micromonas commoda]
MSTYVRYLAAKKCFEGLSDRNTPRRRTAASKCCHTPAMTAATHFVMTSGGCGGAHITKRRYPARPSAMSPGRLRTAPKTPVNVASRRKCLTVVANVVPQGDALPPPAVFNAVLATAEKKAAQDLSTTLVLGFSAGALIGIGALLMSCVGASSPALATANPGLCNFLKGAVGLPAGLTLVILTGAELFTGNVMTMFSGLLAKRIEAGALFRNWLLSYAGNFIGSIVMAYLAFGAKTASAPAAKAAVVGIATSKVSLSFGVALCKGILCNWLVCLAVWGTMASTSVAGKVLAIFWPITAFVTLGFEHSVANMFLIPHGMLNGAQITVKDMMLNNILPVTLGNVISAVIFVAGLHFWAYGRQN